MSTAREFAPARTKDKKRSTPTPARVLAAHAVDAALDKKAHDITVMDMRKVSGIADYFVVCTGDADLQVKAIYEAIEQRLKDQCQERPWHVEGATHRQWVLIDYVDLVVHVFNAEKRAFYDLERLWGDAPKEQVPDDASSSADVTLLQEKKLS
jgi:ribosome-associated protein